MKLFIIEHEYDTDGGFGDAAWATETIGATLDKAEAEDYIKKWSYSEPQVYAKPYDELTCGVLRIREMEIGELPNDPLKTWRKEIEAFKEKELTNKCDEDDDEL